MIEPRLGTYLNHFLSGVLNMDLSKSDDIITMYMYIFHMFRGICTLILSQKYQYNYRN